MRAPCSLYSSPRSFSSLSYLLLHNFAVLLGDSFLNFILQFWLLLFPECFFFFLKESCSSFQWLSYHTKCANNLTFSSPLLHSTCLFLSSSVYTAFRMSIRCQLRGCMTEILSLHLVLLAFCSAPEWPRVPELLSCVLQAVVNLTAVEMQLSLGSRFMDAGRRLIYLEEALFPSHRCVMS